MQEGHRIKRDALTELFNHEFRIMRDYYNVKCKKLKRLKASATRFENYYIKNILGNENADRSISEE